MKGFFAFLMVLLISSLCRAGACRVADTALKVTVVAPEYPGGLSAFDKYIERNLQYPGAARMMCVSGKVYVSFVIDGNGKVTDVSAINCLGAGCESEAVRVVQKSRSWKPALQDGKPVSTNYIVPIDFNMETRRVFIDNMAASGYGFIFRINDKLYTISEAEQMLGRTLHAEKIDHAEPFYNYNDDPKFRFANNREVYLIVIK